MKTQYSRINDTYLEQPTRPRFGTGKVLDTCTQERHGTWAHLDSQAALQGSKLYNLSETSDVQKWEYSNSHSEVNIISIIYALRDNLE